MSVTAPSLLELGGLSLEGRSPLPVTAAVIPKDLRLDGTELRYAVLNGAYRWKVISRPRGVLERFLAIEDGLGVLGFARSFGVLGICVHGLPASHNPMPVPPRRIEFGRDACLPVGYPRDVREPVERWLHFARQARALVRIAAAVYSAGRWPGKDRGDIVAAWCTVLEDLAPARSRRTKSLVTEP